MNTLLSASFRRILVISNESFLYFCFDCALLMFLLWTSLCGGEKAMSWITTDQSI